MPQGVVKCGSVKRSVKNITARVNDLYQALVYGCSEHEDPYADNRFTGGRADLPIDS